MSKDGDERGGPFDRLQGPRQGGGQGGMAVMEKERMEKERMEKERMEKGGDGLEVMAVLRGGPFDRLRDRDRAPAERRRSDPRPKRRRSDRRPKRRRYDHRRKEEDLTTGRKEEDLTTGRKEEDLITGRKEEDLITGRKVPTDSFLKSEIIK